MLQFQLLINLILKNLLYNDSDYLLDQAEDEGDTKNEYHTIVSYHMIY